MKAWLWAEARTGMPRIVQTAIMVVAVPIWVAVAQGVEWLSSAGRCP